MFSNFRGGVKAGRASQARDEFQTRSPGSRRSPGPTESRGLARPPWVTRRESGCRGGGEAESQHTCPGRDRRPLEGWRFPDSVVWAQCAPGHSNPWPAPGKRRAAVKAPRPPSGGGPLHSPPAPCLDKANRERQVRAQNYTELSFSLNFRQVETLIINMINIIKYIVVLFVISLSFPF